MKGAIRIITSLNDENGDIIVNQQTFGFDNEIIKKSDVGHEQRHAAAVIYIEIVKYSITKIK